MDRITLDPDHFFKRYVFYVGEEIIYDIDYERTVASLISNGSHSEWLLHTALPRFRPYGKGSIFVAILYCVVAIIKPSLFYVWLFVPFWILSLVFSVVTFLSMQVDLLLLSIRSFEVIYVFCHMIISMYSLGHLTHWPVYITLSFPLIVTAFANIILSDAWPISISYFTKSLRRISCQLASPQPPRKSGLFSSKRVRNILVREVNPNKGSLEILGGSGLSPRGEIPQSPITNAWNGSHTPKQQDFAKTVMLQSWGNHDSPEGIMRKLVDVHQMINKYVDHSSPLLKILRRFHISESTGVGGVTYLLLAAGIPIVLWIIEYIGLLSDSKETGYIAGSTFLTWSRLFQTSCVNIIAFSSRRILTQMLYPYKIMGIKSRPMRVPLLREWIPIISHMQNLMVRKIDEIRYEDDRLSIASEVELDKIENVQDLDINKDHSSKNTSGDQAKDRKPVAMVAIVVTGDESQEKENKLENEIDASKEMPSQVIDMCAEQRFHASPSPSLGNISEKGASMATLQIPVSAPRRVASPMLHARQGRRAFALSPINEDHCINYEKSLFDFITRGILRHQFQNMAPKLIRATAPLGLACYPLIVFSLTMENEVLRICYFTFFPIGIIYQLLILLSYSVRGLTYALKTFENCFLVFAAILWTSSLYTLIQDQGIRSNLAIFLMSLTLCNSIFLDAHPLPGAKLKQQLIEWEDCIRNRKQISIPDQIYEIGKILALRYPSPLLQDRANELICRPVRRMPIESISKFNPLDGMMKWRRETGKILSLYPRELLLGLFAVLFAGISIAILIHIGGINPERKQTIELGIISIDNKSTSFIWALTISIFFLRRVITLLYSPTACLSLERRIIRVPATSYIDEFLNTPIS